MKKLIIFIVGVSSLFMSCGSSESKVLYLKDSVGNIYRAEEDKDNMFIIEEMDTSEIEALFGSEEEE